MVERSANCTDCTDGTDERPDSTDGVARQRTTGHRPDGDLNVFFCQGEGREFESRRPLHAKPLLCRGFVAFGAWWMTAGLPITPIILPIT